MNLFRRVLNGEGPQAFFDFFLPLSVCLYLLPLDPLFATLFVLAWLVFELALLSARKVLWAPFFLVLLLMSSKQLILNSSQVVFSVDDIILLCTTILVGSTISSKRLTRILQLFLLAVIPACFFINERPWDVNPYIGTTQSAYVIGHVCIVSVFFANYYFLPKALFHPLKGFFIALTFFMVFLTGSRAALVAVLFAAFLVPLINFIVQKKFIPILSMGFITAFVFLQAPELLKSHYPKIALKFGDYDVIRLWAIDCFSGLPFSGKNRFIWGVGYEQIKKFCRIPIGDQNILEHSHNLFLQLWAVTGLLGLIALCLLLYVYFAALFSRWILSERPSFLFLCIGSIVYISVQGLLDLSMLHWPVSIVLSSFFLSIPFRGNYQALIKLH